MSFLMTSLKFKHVPTSYNCHLGVIFSSLRIGSSSFSLSFCLAMMFGYLKGLEWKEKAEKLDLELQQCYKAQSRLAEQLGTEVAEGRSLKASLQEKELAIENLQKEIIEIRFSCILEKIYIGNTCSNILI